MIIDSQHGFSKGKSCLMNLLVFLEKVVGIVDEGDPVNVLYLRAVRKHLIRSTHIRLMKKLKHMV